MRAVDGRRGVAVGAGHAQVVNLALHAVTGDRARFPVGGEVLARGRASRRVGVQRVPPAAVPGRQVAIVVAPRSAHVTAARASMVAVGDGRRGIGRRHTRMVDPASQGVPLGVSVRTDRDRRPRAAVGQAGGLVGVLRVVACAGGGHRATVLSAVGKALRHREGVRAALHGQVRPAVHDDEVGRPGGQVQRQGLDRPRADLLVCRHTTPVYVCAVRHHVQVGVVGAVQSDGVAPVRRRGKSVSMVGRPRTESVSLTRAAVLRVGIIPARLGRVARDCVGQRAHGKGCLARVSRCRYRIHAHAAAVGRAVWAVGGCRCVAVGARYAQVVDLALHVVALGRAGRPVGCEVTTGGRAGALVRVQRVAARAVGLLQVAVVIAPGSADIAAARAGVSAMERRVAGAARSDPGVVRPTAHRVARDVVYGAERELPPGCTVVLASCLAGILRVVAGARGRHRGAVLAAGRNRIHAHVAPVDRAVRAVRARRPAGKVAARHPEVVDATLNAVAVRRPGLAAHLERLAGRGAGGVVGVQLVASGAVGLGQMAVVLTPGAAGVAAARSGVPAMQGHIAAVAARSHARVVGAAAYGVAARVARRPGRDLGPRAAVGHAVRLAVVLGVVARTGRRDGGAVALTGGLRYVVHANAAAVDAAVGAVGCGRREPVGSGHGKVIDPALHRVADGVAREAVRWEVGARGLTGCEVIVLRVVPLAVHVVKVAEVVAPAAAGVATRRSGMGAVHRGVGL